MSGWAFNDDLGAGSIGVELVEFADAGVAFAGVGIEGIAAFGDVVAGVVELVLSVGAGD